MVRLEGTGAGSNPAPVFDPVKSPGKWNVPLFLPAEERWGNPSFSSRRDNAGAATGIRDAGSRVTGIAVAPESRPLGVGGL